ncbi:MAG: TetR/AcrR family transcriptional regulator [Pseudomonadota bacterium]
MPSRQNILNAAGAILARNPGASVAEIAAKAGVGRATLYRFFPTRNDMVRTLALDSLRQIDEATQAVSYESLTAEQALAQIVKIIVPLGDRFRFLANEPAVLNDPEFKAGSERQSLELAELVEAMKAEGSMDQAVSTAWAVATIEALIYAAWTSVDDGSVARRDAAALAFRTMIKGLQAQESGPTSSAKTREKTA